MAGAAISAGGAVAVGLAAAVAGLVGYLATRAPAPSEPEPPAQAAAAALKPTVSGAPDGGAASEPEADAEKAEAAGPTFDLVRVAPDGSAVAAGRAAPGAQVTILGADGPVAEAEADAAGDFVAVFRTAPGTEPQALTLEAEDATGARTPSEDIVVLLPEPPTAAEAGAAAGADAATDTGREAREAATVDPAPEPEVAATAVLRGDDAVEATPTEPGAGLTLASIAYAETGLVTLAGIGPPGARLRAYVDDRFARDGAVGADGRWTLELGDVEAGVYRLRIDALRPDGTVESRVETPFQRDFPAVEPPEGGARPGAITVQPGNNLWTLARIHYGAGVLYTQIYTANRELIRDPELIYPGQIFVLPEGAPAD